MERMVITQVEKQKRRGADRYNIYINDEFAFSVHEDILVKYRLLKGEAIEQQEMESIVREDELNKAYLTAIRFLSLRPRSVKEVRTKLKRSGHEPDLIDSVLERLSSEKYLDDEQFAKLTADNRIRLQRKGRLWIKQELQQKGVPKEQISQTIDEIDQDEEDELAFELARKKWAQLSGDLTGRKRKLLSFLLRRGYTGSTVQRVMKRMDIGSAMDDDLE